MNISYSRKFSPISPPGLVGFCEFLSCANNYIDHVATFAVLKKIYSIKYFCNTNEPGLGGILSSEKFRLYGITSLLGGYKRSIVAHTFAKLHTLGVALK